jgi:hypothetical protein
MKKSDMLQRGNKATRSKKKPISSGNLTDEEDGYSKSERKRISDDLTKLYLSNKSASVLDILIDIQKRLANVEKLLKVEKKLTKAR